MFTKIRNKTSQSLITILFIVFAGLAHGALPTSLNYQGYLRNADGSPVNNTSQSITFTLYDSDAGGTALWIETQNVNITNGVFSVQLGSNDNQLPRESFDNAVWVGLMVGMDAEMTPRSSLDLSAYALKAEDANTVGGRTPAELDQSAHTTDSANPHNVTAAQINAVSSADILTEINDHATDDAAHHAPYTDADAKAAMGVQGNSNTLNHNRFTSTEAISAIKAADGTGSTLDSDFLDGLSSSAFMSAATDNWVNTAGDMMTGPLTVNADINTTTGYQIGGDMTMRVSGSSTFLGIGAGGSTTSSGNTFTGSNAGYLNSSGYYNTFTGTQAGTNNTTGTSNSFIGWQVGLRNTTGSRNTFVGSSAGSFNTTGHSNTFIGDSAGTSNMTGYRNTMVGRMAGAWNVGNDNVFLGYNAGYNETGSEKLYIDNSSTATPLIKGDFSTNKLTFNGDIDITGNIGVGTSSPVYALEIRKNAGGYLSYFLNDNNTVGSGTSGTYLFADGRGTNTGTSYGSRVYSYAGTTSGHAYGIYVNAVANGTSAAFGVHSTATGGNTTGGEFAFYGLGKSHFSDNVSIGSAEGTPAKLHVRRSINATGSTPNHVAIIENTSMGTSPDVLALKVGTTSDPGTAINFISFKDGNDLSLGAIQGNGSGAVTLAGAGADYAEYLPRLNKEEVITKANIVGVFNGKVSKNTQGASRAMVVSSNSIVSGNDPGKNNRNSYSLIAFVGQAEVNVRGSVNAGDYLIPDGNQQGVGIAVSPDAISAEQFTLVVGQAWEASDDTGVKNIRALVGLQHANPVISKLVAENHIQAAELSELRAQLSSIVQQVAQIRSERQQWLSKNTAISE